MLIVIIIPSLALYNINLLTNLDWERRQISHINVKNTALEFMISGHSPSGQLIPPGQLPQ